MEILSSAPMPWGAAPAVEPASGVLRGAHGFPKSMCNKGHYPIYAGWKRTARNRAVPCLVWNRAVACLVKSAIEGGPAAPVTKLGGPF